MIHLRRPFFKVFNDGDFYKGTFKENHFDGRGCYYSAKAGHIFIGHYTNHHKNGLGMYYYKNDDRLKCTWINGEKNGFCKVKIKDLRFAFSP